MHVEPRGVTMTLKNAWILIGAILLLALGANADAPDSDGDGWPNNQDNCPSIFNADQYDEDADEVGDRCDNCTLVGNSGQEDADGDGYGNICDADLDNNGWVGGSDFVIFSRCVNEPGEAAKTACRIADFNSDNRVNSIDFQLFEEMWGLQPGPSGLVP